MITERTLRKWRREALILEDALKPIKNEASMEERQSKTAVSNMARFQARAYVDHVLRMTAELLDQHLMRRPSR